VLPSAKVGLSDENKGCKKCEELFGIDPNGADLEDFTGEEGTQEELKNLNEGESMTKEELQKQHPELYNEVLSDGAKAENERIKAIELAIPKAYSGVEAIQDLKYDQKSTPVDVKAALFEYSEQNRDKMKQNLEKDGEDLGKQLKDINDEDAPDAPSDDEKLALRVEKAKQFAKERR